MPDSPLAKILLQRQATTVPTPADTAAKSVDPAQIAAGLEKMREMSQRMNLGNQRPVVQQPPAAPPVDTSSLGNLLSSLYARGKYAVMGPEGK